MNNSHSNNTRYQSCFDQLKQKGQGAYVPFVMLADPDFETSYKRIITTLIESGADALELGIPFSDPIADGPIIQSAAIRALENGATVKRCFELIGLVRKDYPKVPIGLLVYSNLVVANSTKAFYAQAAKVGVDSVLIADVPVIESTQFIQAANQSNIDPIFIATPNADENKLKAIAQKSQGYTYLLSRAGVTGTEVKAEMPVHHIVETLKKYHAPPSLLGFGISKPKQVKAAIECGADGAISGSAVVRIIQDNLENVTNMLEELSEFTKNMKQATI